MTEGLSGTTFSRFGRKGWMYYFGRMVRGFLIMAGFVYWWCWLWPRQMFLRYRRKRIDGRRGNR